MNVFRKAFASEPASEVMELIGAGQAATSAKQFLAANLEHVAEVVNSKIPYRFW